MHVVEVSSLSHLPLSCHTNLRHHLRTSARGCLYSVYRAGFPGLVLLSIRVGRMVYQVKAADMDYVHM